MSAPTFFEQLNEFLADSEPRVKTQEDLRDFLDATRGWSWDIPSALTVICNHELEDGDETFDFGTVMHRGDEGFNEILVPHFKEVHNFDLTDKDINWSFDT